LTLATQIVADVSDVFLNTSDFAVAITYARGLATVALTAIVEPSEFDNVTAFGSTATRVESRAYLIKASTLILSTVLTLPQIGDTITEGDNVYVIPKGSDRPRYEYADENRLMIRVNTTLKTGT